MNNILYLSTIFLGFVSLLISSIIINKKLKIVSFEKLIYSYILSMIFFLTFSKLFYIILELDFTSFTNFIYGKNINDILKFIFSGYSFIGGYLGIILSNYIYSKIINIDFKKILLIYATSMIIMYSILKIGCFIKGCCIGKYYTNIQIIESVVNLIIYVYLILTLNKKDINISVGKSIIGFSIVRFIISIFRVYSTIYSFVAVEIICLILTIVGVKFINYKRRKICLKKIMKK